MSLSDPKTLMKDNMLLLQDAERERKARRIVDQALKEAIERAEHWENEAHTLGHIEHVQREQIATVRAGLNEALEHLEEITLMLAEVGVRFPDAKVLNEEFQDESEFSYLIAAKIYENFAKATRIKFNLPASHNEPSGGDPGNSAPALPS